MFISERIWQSWCTWKTGYDQIKIISEDKTNKLALKMEETDIDL
jgi:hypothetical protein